MTKYSKMHRWPVSLVTGSKGRNKEFNTQESTTTTTSDMRGKGISSSPRSLSTGKGRNQKKTAMENNELASYIQQPCIIQQSPPIATSFVIDFRL